MKIYGLDFTSTPSTKKGITWAQCSLEVEQLCLTAFGTLSSLDDFEEFLSQPGPWVAGMDFPFGQPRRLVENIGWPQTWQGYIRQIGQMTRQDFVDALTSYRQRRVKGDKQHLRATDKQANSRSPMMLFGVPVGKMFFEGAPRLLKSGASIPPCLSRDDSRIILEAYPALVARRWIGNVPYKADERRKQTPQRQVARERIMAGLRTDAMSHFGFDVALKDAWADACIRDGSGDQLDALLCALQAGWGYLQRDRAYGVPVDCDSLEGWIIDPILARP